jgi:hypothetical protein
MSQIIKIKRSTATTAPTSLANGELAYSAVVGQAQKLFIGRPGGTSGDIDVIGGKYYTDIVDSATDANTASTLVLRDGSGNFSAGTITANLTGNASGNAGTATVLETARNFSASGDATAATVSFDGSADVGLSLVLAASGVTAGNYGSSTAIPTLSIDSKGRVTVAGEASITTSLGIAGDSGSDTISLANDTLLFEGGTGVGTAVDSAANKVTFSIGQAVETTSNVTFNDVVVNGQLTTDDIQAGTLTTSGNVIVQGDLTVNGTTTTVNSNTVNIGDSVITLNSDEAGTPSQNGGIEIQRGLQPNVELVWDEGDDRWQFKGSNGSHYNIPVPTEYDNYTSFSVTDGVSSTAVTSGNSVTFAGTNLSVAEASGTITYSVATATTAVKGIASFDTNYFTVTSGAVTLSNVDGGTF